MAKVKDLKFKIKEQDYVVHVNCNSGGQFIANLPDEVAGALHLQKKLIHNTLAELETAFKLAIEKYKTATTTEQLFIFIQYRSSGKYSKNKNGEYMFQGYNHKYNLEIQWSSAGEFSGIAFDFRVMILRTVDNIESWYSTRYNKEEDTYSTDSQSPYRSVDKWKKIPYSKAALDSLKNAREKIRAASELLFNFIEQEEPQIEYTLTHQKLLGND